MLVTGEQLVGLARVVASRTAAACPVQLQPAIVNTAHCSLQPHAAGDNNNDNYNHNYNIEH